MGQGGGRERGIKGKEPTALWGRSRRNISLAQFSFQGHIENARKLHCRPFQAFTPHTHKVLLWECRSY